MSSTFLTTSMICDLLYQPAQGVVLGEPPAVPGAASAKRFFVAQCDVGLGIFASQDLAPGDHILTFGGPLIDFAETKRRGPWECMAIQIGHNLYLDTRPPGVFVNHSCDPNAGIREDKYLVALRPIRRNQEIRFDYSTTMQEQSFTMTCLCGAPKCRGLIQDFSTLPVDVRDRYLRAGIVMSFIAQQFRAAAVC